jgi:hypothetical protein
MLIRTVYSNNSEVITVMPNQFILATQYDYNTADWILAGGASLPLGVARNLLAAFRTGAMPSGANYSPNLTLHSTNPSLTHPVGAIWNSSNTASVQHFIFPQASSVAQDVANATALKEAIRNRLRETHTVEVTTYFAQNPSATSRTFEWQISPALGIGFGSANPILHAAFGHVTISGEMQVTVRRSDLSVTSITYTGSFTDLYDFNHNAGWPAPDAAKVQTGFSTLGSKGNVFFTTVHFQRQDNNFGFQFQ